MNVDQAQTMARELVEQYLGKGWRIEWNDSDRLFGACQTNRRTIQLSRHFVKRCKRDEVVDTILHEIAHGLTPPEVKPHGAEWRAIAHRLGARPEPCKDTLIYPHLARATSHRRGWLALGAAAVLIAAAAFVTTSLGSGPKPEPAFGTVPVVSAANSTTVPVSVVAIDTTTAVRSTAPGSSPRASSPTTTTRTSTVKTPRRTTTTAALSTPPPATTTTAARRSTTATTYGCTKDPNGNCDTANQPCPSNLHNQTVPAADGPITCTQISGTDWRWEYG